MEISWILRSFITVSGLRLLMKELIISLFTSGIFFETSFVELLLVFSSGWLTGGDATVFTFLDMSTFLIFFISCLRSFISCLRDMSTVLIFFYFVFKIFYFFF